MELTTSWKEEGRQEGRQEGQQQGRQQGRVEMALHLLRRRCGPLRPALKAKVQALSIAELENLAEALLDFTSLADLDRWLLKH